MTKTFLQFLRATLIGGLLFLVPVTVLIIVVGKALAFAQGMVHPLAERLPVDSIIGLRTPRILAAALLVLFCFLAGLLARTAIAKRCVDWLESAVLSSIPGYEFIKGMSESFLGIDSRLVREVVLARIEDSWQLAFVIDRLEGGHVAVFVPGAPRPDSGSVYFMTEDRIRPANISPNAALKILKRLGAGSSALLGRGI